MSKAEERYLEHFQDGRLRNCSRKEAFLLGYHRAEKDLELSWEDIKVIEKLLGFDNIIESPREFYQEVLKRFKAQKGGEV